MSNVSKLATGLSLTLLPYNLNLIKDIKLVAKKLSNFY